MKGLKREAWRFFQLTMLSGGKMGQCHLWLGVAMTIPLPSLLRLGNPPKAFTSQYGGLL